MGMNKGFLNPRYALLISFPREAISRSFDFKALILREGREGGVIKSDGRCF